MKCAPVHNRPARPRLGLLLALLTGLVLVAAEETGDHIDVPHFRRSLQTSSRRRSTSTTSTSRRRSTTTTSGTSSSTSTTSTTTRRRSTTTTSSSTSTTSTTTRRRSTTTTYSTTSRRRTSTSSTRDTRYSSVTSRPLSREPTIMGGYWRYALLGPEAALNYHCGYESLNPITNWIRDQCVAQYSFYDDQPFYRASASQSRDEHPIPASFSSTPAPTQASKLPIDSIMCRCNGVTNSR